MITVKRHRTMRTIDPYVSRLKKFITNVALDFPKDQLSLTFRDDLHFSTKNIKIITISDVMNDLGKGNLNGSGMLPSDGKISSFFH